VCVICFQNCLFYLQGESSFIPFCILGQAFKVHLKSKFDMVLQLMLYVIVLSDLGHISYIYGWLSDLYWGRYFSTPCSYPPPRKVVWLKVVHPLKIYQHKKVWWSHVNWCKFCIHLRSLNVPSPYLNTSSKKIIIQIKLVGMSMIFHCTKLCLSKLNGLRVISIKQNVNFKFQPSGMFVFLVYRGSVQTKSCSWSENLSAYKIS
jgi:hypothetical protein